MKEVLMVMIGVVFLLSGHPLVSVGCLVLMAGLYGASMICYAGGMWYSLLVGLVIMSGVLVVMTYMSSMVPNERFEYWGVMVGGGLGVLGVGVSWSCLGLDESLISVGMWEGGLGVLVMFMLGMLLVIMLVVVWVVGRGEGAVRV